ncbi:MAG TPA: SPOR domain-containing protein [Candidatus Avibacteroides faecavium]|nr:SPOR domain-containing protein [Candidatus Avibacteroides faecavium]
MKKTVYLCAALCAALAMTSCKSSESAYKKAYEKAKQQELADAELQKDDDVTVIETTEPETIEATPIQPAQQQTAATAPERHEKVEVVGNGTLNKFSVVCGSFGLKANAESLKNRMVADGYNALVVFNPEIAMYRVITATFATREEATASREQLKNRYPDNKDFQGAWLLIKAE